MVAELGKSYEFDVEVIKKSEAARLNRSTLPVFPAMEIDDELFSQDRVITVQELEEELRRRNAPRV